MGSYEIDELNYLHYTGDGWITTKSPLTKKELKDWKAGLLTYEDFEWQ